ncbi:MAG: methyltransferase [Armatimonadota bacterium]|nr:MAG: methyltransferase [Armatimonadota bacterium]
MEIKQAIYFADSRNMAELPDGSVHLVVTSPPYWHLKDYGCEGQIGYGQSLHEYLVDLSRVWRECYRVLQPGRRLCINIGDQFARSVAYGRYKVIPLHAEIITQCETIGFDYMGAIIWQKKTTMNTTGGAVVMGSFPYPPNGIVELDYEFILLFKKPGNIASLPAEVKQASALSRDEWKEYFSGHWHFGGTRQVGHEAMFPEELPRRLIRMFSLVGETVLDPFLGSGTTAKVAIELGRQAVGYEIQREFEPTIREKLGLNERASFEVPFRLVYRQQPLPPVEPPEGYMPRIQDARPLARFEQRRELAVKVTAVIDEHTLQIEDGRRVRLQGVVVPPERRNEAIDYLRRYVQGKRIVIKCEEELRENGQTVNAYVYLSNRLFINRKMIERGLAQPER